MSLENKTIDITCQGYTTVPIDELNNLQGNLKDLSEDAYVKLYNSIVTFGFSFPVFMWIDSEGKKWIVDAHQRLRTLKKMREEGWIIPDLPADIIVATDINEAKKKLLLTNSRYGEMTQEGWDEFTAELDYSDIEDMLEIPEMELNYNDTQNEEEQNKSNASHTITCPECGAKFEENK